MALTGVLVADFGRFYDAVQQANVKLTSFEGNAGKVGQALDRMANAFSGKQVIQQATLMVQAVEKIGGTAQLTEKEFDKLQRTVGEAVAKMKAIGAEVPQKFLDIANAAKKVQEPVAATQTAFQKMGGAIQSFVGNLSANLFQSAISSVMGLGRAALDTAGNIVDLSNKLGISTDAVQEFMFIAKQTGTSIDTFASGINKLANNLAKGAGGEGGPADLLNKLGLEFQTIRGMDLETAFRTVATAIGALPDEMEQVRIGTALMGKSFLEMLPSIRDGTFQASKDILKMTREQADALDRAGDEWQAFWDGVVIVSAKGLATVRGIWEETREIMKQQPENEGLRMAAALTGKPDPVAAARIQQQKDAQAKQLAATAQFTKDQIRLMNAADAEAQAYFEREKDRMREEDRLQKEVAQRAADAQRQIEAQRKALEQLGIVTKAGVNAALQEFVTQQNRATAEGVNLDRVLAAQLPKLKELVDAAKKSGISVEGLAKAYNEAAAAAFRLDPKFDVPKGVVDLGRVLGHTITQAERLRGVMSPSEWDAVNGMFATLGHTVEDVNTVMSPEEWNAGRAQAAMKELGITSRDELQRLAADAETDYLAILDSGQATTEGLRIAWEAMIEAQMRASGQLDTYWHRVIIPGLRDAFAGIGSYFSQTFTDMLTGAVAFKDGFLGIWQNIKDTFRQLLADMLNTFIQGFLKGMMDALASKSFGNALGGFVGGGGGGGGGGIGGSLIGGVLSKIPGLGGIFGGGASAALGAMPSAAAQAANMASLGWTVGAPATTAGAGGAGAMGAIGAFATNPFTIVGAGAAALIYGIVKKGLFRGGEEGIKVNPARDTWFQGFVDKYKGQMNPYESLVRALEESGVVGPKASQIISDIYAADTMKEFDAAVAKATEAMKGTPDSIAQPRTQNVTISPGAITVSGVNDPMEISRRIVRDLVTLIVRENPDGTGTILRNYVNA